jgi:hypothetical protein
MTIEQLRELSRTMKDYSDQVGDPHWLAHKAIEELIALRLSAQTPLPIA